MAGNSGKPLLEKLNLKAHHAVGVLNPPVNLSAEFEPLVRPPQDLSETEGGPFDAALIFSVDPAPLENAITAVLLQIADGGLIWLCWPKKTSGIPATIAEADVRRIGLATGWVDVKVCAIDDQWSGLKFLRRRRQT